MPAFTVSRSIDILASVDLVRQSLCDYRQWPGWSPWLIMEPQANLEFNDKQGKVGASYAWQGELVGQGSMELVAVEEQRLEMALSFIKPFKSRARVEFELIRVGDNKTRVTWIMRGSLPFFLFFMVTKMKIYIGMDYERGLNMLKEYIETGKVASRVTVNGTALISAQDFIGIRRQCTFKQLPDAMRQDFTRLYDLMKLRNLHYDNCTPFSISTKFDVVKDDIEYVAAIPVDEPVSALEAPFFNDSLEAMEALKVTHEGRYPHLPNAWATAFNYIRTKRIRIKKSPLGFEFYLNDPSDTAEEALLTEVLIPLK